MVAVALPLNVSARREPATMAAPLSLMAIAAAPIVSGAVPNALLNTARTCGPPMLMRTIWRSVWLLKLSGGGACAAAAAGAATGRITSAVPHVPTQCVCA
jgi:hypothetical protein